ncbi:MAG: hypothetical protein Kow0013_22350 [Pararhodobacter sp.]
MSSLRTLATPLTIGAFGLTAVTGALMFFHLDSGLNKVAHEWLSWALVVGVSLHVAVNFRAFTLYLKRPAAMAIVGAFALLLAGSFLSPGAQTGGSPVVAVMQGLGAAPVERVIALTGEDEASGLARLRAAGIDAAPGRRIDDLSGGDRARQGEILSLIFAR